MLQGEKKLFTQQQKSTKRDVKRALKVFQFQFVIIRDSSHLWDVI